VETPCWCLPCGMAKFLCQNTNGEPNRVTIYTRSAVAAVRAPKTIGFLSSPSKLDWKSLLSLFAAWNSLESSKNMLHDTIALSANLKIQKREALVEQKAKFEIRNASRNCSSQQKGGHSEKEKNCGHIFYAPDRISLFPRRYHFLRECGRSFRVSSSGMCVFSDLGL